MKQTQKKSFFILLFAAALFSALPAAANTADRIIAARAEALKSDIESASARFRAWHAFETAAGRNPDESEVPSSVFEGTSGISHSYSGGILELSLTAPSAVLEKAAELMPMTDVSGGGAKLSMDKSGYRGGLIPEPGDIDTTDFISRAAGGAFGVGANLDVLGNFSATSFSARNLTLTTADGKSVTMGADAFASGLFIGEFGERLHYHSTDGVITGDNTLLRGTFNFPWGGAFSVEEDKVVADNLNVYNFKTPWGRMDGAHHMHLDVSVFAGNEGGASVEVGEDLTLSGSSVRLTGDEIHFLSSVNMETNEIRGTLASLDGITIDAPLVTFTGDVHIAGTAHTVDDYSVETLTTESIEVGTGTGSSKIERDGFGLRITTDSLNLNARNVYVDGHKVLTEHDIVFWPLPAPPVVINAAQTLSSNSGVVFNTEPGKNLYSSFDKALEQSYRKLYDFDSVLFSPRALFDVSAAVPVADALESISVADGALLRDGRISYGPAVVLSPTDGEGNTMKIWIVFTGPNAWGRETARVFIDHDSVTWFGEYNGFRDVLLGSLLPEKFSSFVSVPVFDDSRTKFGAFEVNAPVLFDIPETYDVPLAPGTLRAVFRNEKGAHVATLTKETSLRANGDTVRRRDGADESDFFYTVGTVGMDVSAVPKASPVPSLDGVVIEHLDVPYGADGNYLPGYFEFLGVEPPPMWNMFQHWNPTSLSLSPDMSTAAVAAFETTYSEVVRAKSGNAPVKGQAAEKFDDLLELPFFSSGKAVVSLELNEPRKWSELGLSVGATLVTEAVGAMGRRVSGKPW